MEPIFIVTALIFDEKGRCLAVKKHGQEVLIKPGGKREPGEDELQTLLREVREELGCGLVNLERLGQFEDEAAHQPGRKVEAVVYRATLSGVPTPQNEIEALVWVDPKRAEDYPLAKLYRQVLGGF